MDTKKIVKNCNIPMALYEVSKYQALRARALEDIYQDGVRKCELIMQSSLTKDLEYYMSLPYTIVFYLDEDGDVVAQVKDLQGCSTHGATYREASQNITEAMWLYIEFSLEKALPIPEPEGSKRYNCDKASAKED